MEPYLRNGTYEYHLRVSKLEIMMLFTWWNLALRNGTYEYHLRVSKLEIMMLFNSIDGTLPCEM